MIFCKRHPNYQAKHKPRAKCVDCWVYYLDQLIGGSLKRTAVDKGDLPVLFDIAKKFNWSSGPQTSTWAVLQTFRAMQSINHAGKTSTESGSNDPDKPDNDPEVRSVNRAIKTVLKLKGYSPRKKISIKKNNR